MRCRRLSMLPRWRRRSRSSAASTSSCSRSGSPCCGARSRPAPPARSCAPAPTRRRLPTWRRHGSIIEHRSTRAPGDQRTVDLPFIWFVLLGVLLTGYATLDGFDLGVGILHFVARDDRERRIFLRAIGPIWDGNEVWLVTFGGALFAAFPEAYATIFSAYYLLVMCLLGALIFRAAAIEFRGTLDSPIWRRGWDIGRSAASALASFLFGVSVGNAMLGIPLDAQGNSVGSTADLFGVYPALIGAL